LVLNVELSRVAELTEGFSGADSKHDWFQPFLINCIAYWIGFVVFVENGKVGNKIKVKVTEVADKIMI
jgi:hypothetical protein